MKKLFGAVNFLSGLFLSLTPFVLFPVCDTTEKVMGCYYSGIFITCAGIFIALISLLSLFFSVFTKNFSLVIISAAALSCWLVPNKIIELGPCGLCANPAHPCQASTMPAVEIIIALIFTVCIAGIIFNFVKGDFSSRA